MAPDGAAIEGQWAQGRLSGRVFASHGGPSAAAAAHDAVAAASHSAAREAAAVVLSCSAGVRASRARCGHGCSTMQGRAGGCDAGARSRSPAGARVAWAGRAARASRFAAGTGGACVACGERRARPRAGAGAPRGVVTRCAPAAEAAGRRWLRRGARIGSVQRHVAARALAAGRALLAPARSEGAAPPAARCSQRLLHRRAAVAEGVGLP
jgi:hypothetical protein